MEIGSIVLPHDVAIAIFACLGPADIVKLACVCPGWKKIAFDQFLWYTLCSRVSPRSLEFNSSEDYVRLYDQLVASFVF